MFLNPIYYCPAHQGTDMITEKINGYRVEIYESIEEMPAVRFNRANKYLLLQSGIGSSLADFDKHLAKLSLVIKGDNKKKAIDIINNMRQLYWNIDQGMNVEQLSFACFVHSINGTIETDHGETRLKEIIKRLSDPTKVSQPPEQGS